MGKQLKSLVPEEARTTEMDYHRRQNPLVILIAVPTMLLYAGIYFYLERYFQSSLFILMSVNTITGLIIIISYRLKTYESLVILKRVTTSITFTLLAVNLLTGLWDAEIYYIVLPWVLLYPLAAIVFFARRQGFITAILFSIIALISFLVLEMPPLTELHVQMFKLNLVMALFSILSISLIYEKVRVKVQDDLALSQNEYRLAEKRQRETNVELKHEIARREEFEKALQESALHYWALFEESTVALWEEDWSDLRVYLRTLPAEAHDDLAGYLDDHPSELDYCKELIKTTAVNRAALDLFEITRADVMPANLHHLLGPRAYDYLKEQIAAFGAVGRFDTDLSVSRSRSGMLCLHIASSIPAGYEDNWERIYTSVYDLTERIRMEEEKKRVDEKLHSARQIQAIATLAGGIAHQFNNALAVIYGSLDLLEIKAGENAESKRFLATLKASAARMGRLTDQLLAYAEGGKYQPQIFSVNDLVTDVIASRIMMRDSAIIVKTALADSPPLINGDLTQLRMVMESVIANAFEALGQGGEVRIATGSQPASETLAPGPNAQGGPDYAFVRVQDNGVGMDPEVLNRIFEPFYTTKIYGRGLGMAAAFGIVRNHDGMITVESEPDQGTTVTIYLPLERRLEKHARHNIEQDTLRG